MTSDCKKMQLITDMSRKNFLVRHNFDIVKKQMFLLSPFFIGKVVKL